MTECLEYLAIPELRIRGDTVSARWTGFVPKDYRFLTVPRVSIADSAA